MLQEEHSKIDFLQLAVTQLPNRIAGEDIDLTVDPSSIKMPLTKKSKEKVSKDLNQVTDKLKSHIDKQNREQEKHIEKILKEK